MKHHTFTAAALHVVHRDEVHIYRFMQLASCDVSDECFHLFQKALWEAFPLLSCRLDTAGLESKTKTSVFSLMEICRIL